MNHYHLVKDDVESLNELSSWPGHKDPMSDISSKVKSAFTRAYNKSAPTYSVIKKNKKTVTVEAEGLLDNDEEIEVNSDEEEDDITNDTLISVVSINSCVLFLAQYSNYLIINLQVKKKESKKVALPSSNETSKSKGKAIGGRKKK